MTDTPCSVSSAAGPCVLKIKENNVNGNTPAALTEFDRMGTAHPNNGVCHSTADGPAVALKSILGN
jgi:hypothetical protein